MGRHDPGLFFLLGTRARSNFINSGSSRPGHTLLIVGRHDPDSHLTQISVVASQTDAFGGGSSRPRRTLLIVDRHDPGLFFLLGTRGRSNFINSGSSRPRLAPYADIRGYEPN